MAGSSGRDFTLTSQACPADALGFATRLKILYHPLPLLLQAI
jgi:hypothetical protein